VRRTIAGLLVALLVVTTTPAGADKAEDAALGFLDRGVAAYRAGNYEQARREFEAARGLVPDKPNPYRWLGLTEAKLGNCTEALQDFAVFLRLVPRSDERVPEVLAARDQCRRAQSPSQSASPSPSDPPLPRTPTPTTTPTPTPTLVAPPPPPPEPPSSSLTRRWWFWPTVGAAALVATGVTLGLVLGAGNDEGRLPPLACGPLGCDPSDAARFR
jgi:tetratricopeptide (TPR) repeat protein